MSWGDYMKRTGRRSWRHRLDPGRKQFLKKALTVALVLECLQLFPVFMRQIITEDRIRQIEWVSPATGAEAMETNIYGIRFFQETGGLQFYHTRQSVKDDY